MKIKIVQVGKTKDRYLQDGVAEFEKRLSRFVDLETITVKEVGASNTFTVEKAVDKEGELIIEQIEKLTGGGNSSVKVVALAVEGKMVNSEELAEMMGDLKDKGLTLVFVIGGAYGLSEAVLAAVDHRVSFSRLTFTHQMIRLILLEQIYRGQCILIGKSYHH